MIREGWGGDIKALFVALVLVEGLGGCSPRAEIARPAVLDPLEVDRPIATGCVPPNIAPEPEYPDSDGALSSAADAAERYQLLYAGRKIRVARLNELEPIVAACPKAATK